MQTKTMSGTVQVGGKFKAGKLVTYSSGRVSCRIFGTVQNYYGLQALPGAMYPVTELDADSVEELRTLARATIDAMNKAGTRLVSCTSVKLFKSCYA